MLRVSGSARIIIPSQRGGDIPKSFDSIAPIKKPKKTADLVASRDISKSTQKVESKKFTKIIKKTNKNIAKPKVPITKDGPWWVIPLKVTGVIVTATILVTISFAGATYAYQDQYGGRALLGTKILGEDMGGLTQKQILRKVEDSLSSVVFDFSIDGSSITAKPAEVGISYQIEETAQNAFSLGRHSNYFKNLAYSGISLTYGVNPMAGEWLAKKTNYKIYQNVKVVYKIDNTKIDTFTKKVSKQFGTKSKDAGLVMKGTNVQVIPAVYGRAVATESIKAQINKALATGASTTININVAEVRPEIIEAEAADAIASAEEILDLSVGFTYKGKKYSPSKETVGGWLVFKKNGKKLSPIVDSAKVARYLNTVAKDINISAINQKIKVINDGKREIIRKGKDGLAVDVNTAAAKTATSLNARNNSQLELSTQVVKYKTEFNNVVVAKWDKYIEIDIGTQRMCAYLAGGEKVNCWAITTGQNNVINGLNTNTPTGTFLIRRKSGAGGVAGGPGGGGVCMPNPPYSTPLCGINYVSTFTPQGHAIHEAWWRTSFGTSAYRWNGSHGCVNSPYNVAKFIYYWAPIGTPVVIHY